MENKVLVNMADIDAIKGFYGKTREEMSQIIVDNREKLSDCPDYCELKKFFEEILK